MVLMQMKEVPNYPDYAVATVFEPALPKLPAFIFLKI